MAKAKQVGAALAQTPGAADGEDPALRIGPALREARIRAGLTQAEVAARAGLSVSFVRLVEQGRSDISLSRLLNWTTLFNIPVADLFADGAEPNEVLVVRRSDRLDVATREHGVTFQLLAPARNREIEPGMFLLSPGAEMRHPLLHLGEETAFVVRGSVRIYVGGGDFHLQEGDSAYYRSELPHRFANPNKARPAELLVTTTNPVLHVWASSGSGLGEPVRTKRKTEV